MRTENLELEKTASVREDRRFQSEKNSMETVTALTARQQGFGRSEKTHEEPVHKNPSIPGPPEEGPVRKRKRFFFF